MADIKHSDDRIGQMKFVKRKVEGVLNDPRLRYDYANREVGTLPEDGRAGFKWVSEVAYKNIHRIVSRGYDTTEIVEAGYGMTDVLFIDYQARIPFVEERKVLDYCLMIALEDGLSAPAVLARIIARGKNYITQSCGGSTLAYGHAYASYDATGKMLTKYLAKVEEGMSIADAAALLVKENAKEDHLGISDRYLKDPTARKILDMIERTLPSVKTIKYVPFMKEVVKAAKASLGNVDIDLIGAMTAAMMDLEFSADAAWCIMAVTRAFGASSHAIEELEREDGFDYLGSTLTPKEWYDGPADREVPSLETRNGFAGAQAETAKEWQDAWKKKAELFGSGFAIDFYIEDPRKATTSQKK